MHKSFKNFAKFGICLIASKRGMLTSTLLKVSRRSDSSSAFFVGMTLEGKGRGICLGVESDLVAASILVPASTGFGVEI